MTTMALGRIAIRKSAPLDLTAAQWKVPGALEIACSGYKHDNLTPRRVVETHSNRSMATELLAGAGLLIVLLLGLFAIGAHTNDVAAVVLPQITVTTAAPTLAATVPTIIYVASPTPQPTLVPTPTPTPVTNDIKVGGGYFGWWDSTGPSDFNFSCSPEVCPNLLISHTYYVCATGMGFNSNSIHKQLEPIQIIHLNEKPIDVSKLYPICVEGNYVPGKTGKISMLSENLRAGLMFRATDFPILNIEIYDKADGQPAATIIHQAR